MAYNAYLKLDGIKGEAADGSIQVLSWTWGVSIPTSQVTGAGGPIFQLFTFHSEIGAHTPQLLGAMVGEKNLSGGIFQVKVAHIEKHDGVTFAFNGALKIDGYEFGGNSAAPLQEEFTLNFSKLTMSSGGDKVACQNNLFNNT